MRKPYSKAILSFFICALLWNTWGKTEIANATEVANHLLIGEIYYDTIGDDNLEEWVEIYNPTISEIDLSNYKIGDEESQSGSESMYQFPADSQIGPNETKVIAKNALGFYALYGKYPDFEILSTDDTTNDFSQTPDMTKYPTWANGSFSLTNTGDEILLLDDADSVIDAVTFENGIFPGVTAHPGVPVGDSLERFPRNQDTDNCATDFQDRKVPNPGYDFVYESDIYFGDQGNIVDDASAEGGKVRKAVAATDSSGYLFFGPYEADMTPGMYQVVFRLKISDNNTDNVAIRIDAHNYGGSGWWVTKDIMTKDFNSPDSWQNFYLWFERVPEGLMEYRVYTYDDVDVSLDNIMVGKVDRLIFEAENMEHSTGTLGHDTASSGGRTWQATQTDAQDFMVYGPYTPLAKGKYQATYVAQISDNASTALGLTIDVNNAFGTDSYHAKTLLARDFSTPNTYQAVNLDFARNDSGVMEFRAFFDGYATVTLDNIIISQKNAVRYEAEDMSGAVGTIADDPEASGGRKREAILNADEAGWMMFGPYTTDQTPGSHQAVFRLKNSENDLTVPVAKIDVFNSGGTGQEAGREIFGTDFTGADTWQDFPVDFERTADGTIEYRVYFYDLSDIKVDYVEVK